MSDSPCDPITARNITADVVPTGFHPPESGSDDRLCRSLHCAAESGETHNPNIVVRYRMEGQAQLVDVGWTERNLRPSGAGSSGVSYVGAKSSETRWMRLR
jgi:hypothetical protein